MISTNTLTLSVLPRFVLTVLLARVLLSSGADARAAERSAACRIEIVDKETGWPVPLVELSTNHHVRFVSDNAGLIAFDLLELMGRETWFNVRGHGYEVSPDGFGLRGVRLTPQPGATLKVEVTRTNIAKRLGRITGAGLFAESQKLGLAGDWQESGILGSDSVQLAAYRDRLFWAWGDTTIANYALGIFDAGGATSAREPLSSFEPPVRLKFDYFADGSGRPRGVAPMPGPGPTWLGGYVTLPDKSGAERLVASYIKVKPPMDAYEHGFCVWNDDANKFEHLRTVWTKSDADPKGPPMPTGHPAIYELDGKRWVLFGHPLPTLRCLATFEAWQDPANWETLTPQEQFDAPDGAAVKPHSGSIAWNAYRGRWVAVFMEYFGKPSAFGEVWYAEADEPTGPWGTAVKILTHENYAFYNPRIDFELTPEGSSFLLFEGTYSHTFADRPEPTPRYDYNQVLYRLDLDDPRLEPARGGQSSSID